MIWQRLKNKVLHSKKSACVHVDIRGVNDVCYNLCLLEEAQGKVVLQEKVLESISLDEIAQFLNPNIALVLCIHGKGVLSKKVWSDVEDLEQLTKSTYPNVKTNDFYLQKYGSDSPAFLTILRKDALKSIISPFLEKKIFFSSLYVGPFVCETLSPFLGSEGAHISIPLKNDALFIENGIVRKQGEVTESIENINIAGQSIEKEATLAYAGALNFYLRTHNVKNIRPR